MLASRFEEKPDTTEAGRSFSKRQVLYKPSYKAFLADSS
jgi:hypothetical protein